jgi:hypothetical protein
LVRRRSSAFLSDNEQVAAGDVVARRLQNDVNGRAPRPFGRCLRARRKMTVTARTTVGRGLAIALSLAVAHLAVPTAQAATTHLVDQSQMVQRLVDSAKSREEKVQLFQRALDTPEVRRQAKSMGLDADKIRAGIPHLTDAELQDLSRRAANTKDVVAGHHTSDSGLIILGVVLLVAGIALLVALADDGYYDDCYCY